MKSSVRPLVSILIPVFQREALIEECVRSALASDYPNFEVIVCDNASTDATLQRCQEIANRDPRLRVFPGTENIGPVGNWKRCADLAQGEYVKMLFSDDRVEPQFLSAAVEAIEQDGVGVVYSAVAIFGEREGLMYSGQSGRITKTGTRRFISRFYDSSGSSSPVSPGCTLMRTRDFRDCLSSEFRHSAFTDFADHGGGPDVALIHRVAFRHRLVVHIDMPLNGFRSHGGSFTMAGSRKIWLRQLSAALSAARDEYGDEYFYSLASRVFLKARGSNNNLTPAQFAADYGLICDPGKISRSRGFWFKARTRLWKV